jgi:hypothetical protein
MNIVAAMATPSLNWVIEFLALKFIQQVALNARGVQLGGLNKRYA